MAASNHLLAPSATPLARGIRWGLYYRRSGQWIWHEEMPNPVLITGPGSGTFFMALKWVLKSSRILFLLRVLGRWFVFWLVCCLALCSVSREDSSQSLASCLNLLPSPIEPCGDRIPGKDTSHRWGWIFTLFCWESSSSEIILHLGSKQR